MNQQNGGSQAQENGADESCGVFNGFEAYVTATDAEYTEALTRGLVVVDANVLLNLYRYNGQSRDDLLAALSAVGDKLWLPHRVVAEFWKNRESVLSNPRDTASTIQRIADHREGIANILNSWFNRASIAEATRTAILEEIDRAYVHTRERVESLAQDEEQDYRRDTNLDPVLAALSIILDGKVGMPFTDDEEASARKEAMRRIEGQEPPGYKDKKKGDTDAVGDYFVWRQLLIEAAVRQVSYVLFVTNDLKEDWWRKEGHESRGPRLELSEELRSNSGSRLLFTRTASFLRRVAMAFPVDLSPASAEDVSRVDAIYSGDDRLDLLSFSPMDFENVVRELFLGMGYKELTSRPARGDLGIDLLMTDRTGVDCIVDVKQYRKPISAGAVHELAGRLISKKGFRAVLVTTSFFTKSAREAAHELQITLVDGPALIALFKQHLDLDVVIHRSPDR